jgi:HK97 family phage prohead protease
MTTQWLSPERFAELAAKGETPDAMLRKEYIAEISQKGAAESRTLTFTVSTGAVDRERDVIDPEGWKLTAFRRNPTILWAHDYKSLPVGRATKIRVEDGKLRADIEFAPVEANPLAESVFQLAKGGFLNATSVGFRPLEHSYNAERGGVDFKRQELLEVSIVPVPANPEALMEGKAAGIDLAPLQIWAKGILTASEPSPPEPEPTPPPKSDNAAESVVIEGRLDRIEQALAKLTPVPPAESEILMLALDEDDTPPEEKVLFDPDAVTAAIATAFETVVAREVRSALNTLRGRVD